MKKIFLWFYCLPIWKAILLMLLATAAFLFLREKLRGRPYWKVCIMLFFLAWIAVVLFGTLGQRTEVSNLSEPILMPFASYYAALHGGSREIYRTNFMNAVLFYPAGLLGWEVLPNRWRKGRKVVLVTGVFVLVSVGIEYMQYCFSLGLTEIDDVIHNALGSLLGAIACGLSLKPYKK